MDEKKILREHLDGLFAAAPRSRAAYELQEELMANSLERYGDLVKGGMGEEAAIQAVIGSIGNVDELLAGLPTDDPVSLREMESERRARSAVTVTVAVGLYVLAGVVFFVGGFLSEAFWPNAGALGLVLALLICIAPTCMLVYNAYRWPRYKKEDNTVVEEFKAWNNDSRKTKSLRGAVSALLWTVAVFAYLAVSFATFDWQITWIIFVAAACFEAVIGLVFRLREFRQ